MFLSTARYSKKTIQTERSKMAKLVKAGSISKYNMYLAGKGGVWGEAWFERGVKRVCRWTA